MTTRRYALREDQWERIKNLLPKRNRQIVREYDKELYKARHLIENFFAKLKQYRAIATRYDERAVNFLGAIYLAASVIWLN
jgi:transposase